MESLRPSTSNARRHGRDISHPVPTRATAGPLDAAEDPLADRSGTASAKDSLDSSPSVPEKDVSPPRSAVAAAAAREESASRPSSTDPPPINLQVLLDPKTYHLLNTDDIPDAFSNSEYQPSGSAALPDLLQSGHFRRAAEIAKRALLQSAPDAVDRIFQLLYTRLACLVLLSRPDFAAEEAVPLTDLLVRNPAGTSELVPRIPWELRLLLVRLQSIGTRDGGRRSVMSLYALAGEARAQGRRARAEEDAVATETWSARLRDLGWRVCDTLVEMGELETAVRHLDTLAEVRGNAEGTDEVAYRKALLRIRVGDIGGAQGLLEGLQSPMRRKGLGALIRTAIGRNGDSDEDADADHDALSSWQELLDDFPGHELFAQNAAVSMLYTGHITSARDLLEELAKTMPMFPALLFNLGTVYELCTERAVERKVSLTQASAAKDPSPASGGWERANFEYKL